MFLHRALYLQLVLTGFSLTGCASEHVYQTGPVVPQPVYRGEDLDLEWTTSLPDDHILWCYWKYELGGAWDQFVGFHNTDNIRLNISPWNRGWSFTNIGSPCQGGIKRASVSNEVTGNYVMVIGLQNGTVFESGKFPVSVAVCRRPEKVTGANLTTDTESDTVRVTYTCSHGDNITLECNVTSGQWSRDVPICQGPIERTKFPGWAVVVLVCVILLVLGLVLILLRKKTSIWDCRRSPIPSDELEFSYTYSDTTVGEHCDLHLVVKLSTHRHINVQWFKDDLALRSGKTYSIKDKKNIHSLKIKRSSPEMTGVYTCRATDPSDVSITHSAHVTVLTEDMFAPVFSESLPNRITTKASTEPEIYKAIIKGNPRPEIQIFRNDEQWTGSDHLQLTYTEVTEGMELLLTLSQCTLEDMCQLRVQAGNVLDVTSEETEIVVQSPPQFLSALKHVDVYDGDVVDFGINVQGFPLPTVEWYKKHDLLPCTLTDINKYTCTARVTLKDVRVDDSGTVEIRAYNICGKEDTSAELKVHEIIPPKFKYERRRLMVKPSEKATLSVVIEASPAPSVTWYKDNQPLVQSESIRRDITLQSETVTVHSIEICGTAVEDTGRFRVEAKSDYYRTSSSKEITLTVSETTEPPSFTQTPPAKMYVMKGGQLECTAAAVGTPTPEITWKLLSRFGDRRTKEGGFGSSRLIIRDMSKKDSDPKYTVIAESEAGKKEFSFSVTVLDTPIYPSISKLTPQKMALANNDVQFKATVEGFPLPEIYWYLNGNEVTKCDRFDVQKSELSPDSVETVLTVTACQADDDGFVVLKASNKGGSTAEAAKLIVNVRPQFIKCPDSVMRFLRGTDAVLYCEVAGKPPPETRWDTSYWSGSPKHETPGRNISKLFMKDISDQHSGTYQVLATNDGGTAYINFQVEVVVPEENRTPDIDCLSDETRVEGEEVIFSARIREGPLLSIDWFVNDINVNEVRDIKVTSQDVIGSLNSINEEKETEVIETECKETSNGNEKMSTKNTDWTHEKEELETSSSVEETNMQMRGENQGTRGEILNTHTIKSESDSTQLPTEVFSKLIIPKCEVKHEGFIKLVATNKSGTASRMCTLTVHVKPLFRETPDDVVTFPKVQSAVLFAEATGKPEPKIKWDLQTGLLFKNIKYDNSGGRSTAVIKSFDDSNIGKCKVTATNIAGTVVKEFRIRASAQTRTN